MLNQVKSDRSVDSKMLADEQRELNDAELMAISGGRGRRAEFKAPRQRPGSTGLLQSIPIEEVLEV